MSQIFILVYDLDALGSKLTRHLTPFVLARVCSEWRSIAWSTPHLWTYFHVLQGQLNEQKQINILKFCLQMAKEVPFTLSVSFPPARVGIDNLCRFCNILVTEGVGSKIRSLELWNVKKHEFVRPFLDLQLVENLTICITYLFDSSLDTLCLEGFRHLCQLEVFGFRGCPRRMVLSSSQITSLTLNYISVRLGLFLLTQCPNLASFRSLCPITDFEIDMIPLIGDQVLLKHLSDLTWTYRQSIHYGSVFPHLRLPALRTLIWCRQSQPKPDIDVEEDLALGLLVQNLPASLHTLEISSGGKWNLSLLSSLFTRVSGIKHLRLLSCRHVFISDVLSLLLAKTPPTVERGVLLPSLEDLVILDPRRIFNDGPNWTEHSTIRRIESLFRAQRPYTRRTFTVHFVRQTGRWTREMYRAFAQLQRRQYPFHVWVDATMTSPLTAADTIDSDARSSGLVGGRKRPWRP